MMKKALVAILLTFSACYTTVSAQEALIMDDQTGWQKIGKKTISLSRTRDQIRIEGTNRFTAIKYKVSDAAVNLIALEVNYETGNNEQFKIETPVNQGEGSQVIPLYAGERDLRKIVFVYKAVPKAKGVTAQVEIWGLQAKANPGILTAYSSELPIQVILADENSGWEKISDMIVDFRKDQDKMKLPGVDRFSMIRFKVDGTPVAMSNMTIEYENGSYQMVSQAAIIEPGTVGTEIPLNYNERMKSIVFVCKPPNGQNRGKAHVEVWGNRANQDQSSQLSH